MELTMAKPRAKRPPLDAGGRELLTVEMRGTSGRQVTHARAKPGGFDWLSARRRLTAGQEQAGMHLRRVWEAAGAREPGSPLWGSPQSRTAVYDVPEPILEAWEESDRIARLLGGRFTSRLARLRAFVLDELSESEMAQLWDVPLKSMRLLIRRDLDCAARKLGY